MWIPNINCKYYDRSSKNCNHKEMKWFFGLFKKTCVKIWKQEKCSLQEKYSRPLPPPAPPAKRLIKNV